MPNSARSADSAETIDLQVSLAVRDELRLQLEVDGGVIVSSRLQGIGCAELLSLMAEWRSRLTGTLADLMVPEGQGHADILLRELILRAQGRWKFPYSEPELCHCRAVPTKVVDDAIIGGAQTLEAVMRQTSACTSCGSCRPDIEKILAYRLKPKI